MYTHGRQNTACSAVLPVNGTRHQPAATSGTVMRQPDTCSGQTVTRLQPFVQSRLNASQLTLSASRSRNQVMCQSVKEPGHVPVSQGTRSRTSQSRNQVTRQLVKEPGHGAFRSKCLHQRKLAPLEQGTWTLCTVNSTHVPRRTLFWNRQEITIA